ncbi:hypothetical protein [Paenibacillus pabuli]|uniref:hypothetical protein n=1 Tax=Paenibacillus pabuli TaxID=1472 RepID=UPI000B140C6F|nr:hypothetical protein [Paenibacillus pabuli]MEC0128684.1 hypothetical protein [Paenibacillus pabuli]
MNKRSIRYPQPLVPGDNIGVAAPSSGVGESLHYYLEESRHNMERLGYGVGTRYELRGSKIQ